jgi:hypothetical protein
MATTILSTLCDVAIADQPDRAAADVAHRLAEARVGRPAPTVAGRPVQRGQPPQRGQHQQYGALRDRGRVRAGHVRHRDAQPRRGFDVDGVDPRAHLVHEPQVSRLFEVVTGDGTQHVPDHLGLGQVAVESVVVILAAVADIEPIRLWCEEFGDLLTRDEVCEDSQRHLGTLEGSSRSSVRPRRESGRFSALSAHSPT